MADTNADLRKDIDALKEDFGKIRDDLATLVGAAADAGKDRAEEARQKADDYRRQSQEALEGMIQDRPVTSLLAAFGAGFLLANLFSMRRQ